MHSSLMSRTFGAILLVASCCIGTGMLGLPVLSAASGFWPSTTMLVIGWGLMCSSGLLLLEVNLSFGGEVSLLTLVEKTLGRVCKFVCWTLYLFLFYTLMVAFVTGSGLLVGDAFEKGMGVHVQPGIGGAVCAFFLGVWIFRGVQKAERVNRFLTGGLVLCYVALLAVGAPHVQTEQLFSHNWKAAPLLLPVVLVSFGFHNLIPTLVGYLERDRRALVWSMILGSLLPLLVYIAWEGLILGLVPQEGFQAALSQGEMATEVLKNGSTGFFVAELAQGFAFFAITTSFLGVALSFVDFLADGLGVAKTASGKSVLLALVLLPPVLAAFLHPDIFLQALGMAGGYGAATLFGFFPVWMAWKRRDQKNHSHTTILPGGKLVLLVLFFLTAWIVFLQTQG